MNPIRAALAATLMLSATAASARPVSYPGSITVLQERTPMLASLHVHYSPSRHWSTGPRLLHLREEDTTLIGAQATWLARRWNMPAAQARAAACTRLRRLSAIILWISAAIWATGFFFAFLAADLLL